MLRKTAFISVMAAMLLVVVAPAHVRAHTYDRLAYLTFSGPVQVPGAMLDAGTYRFRIVNPDSGMRVFQVLSHDGTTVHAMFFTLPDTRVNVTPDATVTFREMPAGVTPAVKSMFYGGERAGYEFVYSGGWPIMTPKTWPQPAITYAPIPAAGTPEAVAVPEPLPIEAPAELAATPLAESTEAVGRPAPELPKTASSVPLPLIALGGLTSLVLGLGAGLLRRHLL